MSRAICTLALLLVAAICSQSMCDDASCFAEADCTLNLLQTGYSMQLEGERTASRDHYPVDPRKPDPTPEIKHKDKMFQTSKSLDPPQFLLVSSPSKSKVAWTTLENLESGDFRPFPLIDTGLMQPKGLAFDHKRGHLFVADSGAEKIFRYTILVDSTDVSKPIISISHLRLVIVEDCGPVEWVTVDDAGNLFYSAPKTNNINKVPADVMFRLASGEFKASILTIMSEKKLEAQQEASTALKKAAMLKHAASRDTKQTSNKSDKVDEPPPQPHILSIYEAALNPRVEAPGAILAEGPDLYWANQKGGNTAGMIVKGFVSPNVTKKADGSPAPFPAKSLSTLSAGAQSIAKTGNTLFFTRKVGKNNVVSALRLGTDMIIDMEKTLVLPRGLAWDKDSTMYVADEEGDTVWSFATGRMMENAPLTKTVDMAGAFGLAILSSVDPCFVTNTVDREGRSVDALADKMYETVAGRTQTGSPESDSTNFIPVSVDEDGDRAWLWIALAIIGVLGVAMKSGGQK